MDEEAHKPTGSEEIPSLRLSIKRYLGDVELEHVELEVKSYNPESCVALMDHLIAVSHNIKR